MNHMRRPDRAGKKPTSKAPTKAKKDAAKNPKTEQKKVLKGVQK